MNTIVSRSPHQVMVRSPHQVLGRVDGYRLVLTSSPNPNQEGDLVTITATVTVGGVSATSGDVVFFVEGGLIGVVPIVAGVAVQTFTFTTYRAWPFRINAVAVLPGSPPNLSLADSQTFQLTLPSTGFSGYPGPAGPLFVDSGALSEANFEWGRAYTGQLTKLSPDGFYLELFPRNGGYIMLSPGNTVRILLQYSPFLFADFINAGSQTGDFDWTATGPGATTLATHPPSPLVIS